MRYGQLIFVCALFSCFAAEAASASDIDAISQKILSWYKRADSKPDYMYREGKRILDSGRLRDDCDSLMVGTVLMMRACNNAPGQFEFPPLGGQGCELEGQLFFEELAFKDFLEGEFADAAKFYEQALEYAEDLSSRVKIMQAIGTCWMQAENTDRAVFWYKASAEFGLEYLTSINFSNISNAYLGASNPMESLVWSRHAEAKLIEEFQSGLSAESFARRLDLILNNQVLACVDLGDLEEAERAFQRMNLEGFYPNMVSEFYHMALILAWAIDDPYPIEMHQSVFAAELIADSLNAVARFGPTLALVEPWRTAWESNHSGGHSVWSALRVLPDSLLPEMRQQRAEALGVDSGASFWELSGVLLGLAGLLGGLIFFIRQRQLGAKGEGGVEVNLAQIRNFLMNPESWKKEEAMRAFNSLQPLVQFPEVPPELGKRDIEVLMAILQNERPKETAARLDISTKSVYMIRSELKKKLELDADKSLADWLTRFKSPNR